MTLEEIMQAFGCKKPFKENGDFTKSGIEAYGKLIEVIMAVGELTGCDSIEGIITELDKICNE